MSQSGAVPAFVPLEFPSWIRWGQRRGAFIDNLAILALRPNHRHWVRNDAGWFGYVGDVFHCGWCLAELSGRRTSWCSDACSWKFYRVWSWGTLAKYIRERDAETCQRCGTTDPGEAKGKRADAWDVDHIVPVKDGGTDDPTNLRLVCYDCHVAIGYDQRAARALRMTEPTYRATCTYPICTEMACHDYKCGPNAWHGRFTHCVACPECEHQAADRAPEARGEHEPTHSNTETP